MRKGIIGLIVAIILLFNFGQFKAESSPQSDALVRISDRMGNTLLELSAASLNFELTKIPVLIGQSTVPIASAPWCYSSTEGMVTRKKG